MMHTTAELRAVTELSAQSVYRLALQLPLDILINIDMRPSLEQPALCIVLPLLPSIKHAVAVTARP